MIKQRVKLAKLKTDDGKFDFSQKNVPVGTTFWIDARSIGLMPYKRIDTGEFFQALVVETAEEGIHIPVELLEFSSDFEVIK